MHIIKNGIYKSNTGKLSKKFTTSQRKIKLLPNWNLIINIGHFIKYGFEKNWINTIQTTNVAIKDSIKLMIFFFSLNNISIEILNI